MTWLDVAVMDIVYTVDVRMWMRPEREIIGEGKERYLNRG